MDEVRYKQLLPQFRAKTDEEVWFAMHSAPAMPEYKLAGELVLAEREQTAVQLRARWALGVSVVALAVSFGSLYVSSMKLQDDHSRRDAILH